MYNSVELVQVVRVRIVESGGLYIAWSTDVPGMQASAFDQVGLGDAMQASISRYFYSRDEPVHVERSTRGGPNDLSTWYVSPLSYRDAAE